MEFWKTLWTLLWFGGLALFAILSVVITVRGARDLRALLRSLREEVPRPPDPESR
jgi:hypothetical protein